MTSGLAKTVTHGACKQPLKLGKRESLLTVCITFLTPEQLITVHHIVRLHKGKLFTAQMYS